MALDGPAFPVPSWRLVVETYDANRLQYSIGKLVEAYNRHAPKQGKTALRFAQETVGGRTYYMLGTADQNPLTEGPLHFRRRLHGGGRHRARSSTGRCR